MTENFDILVANLKKMEKVAVAFSAGVDSSFLLKAASIALGENLLAVTAKSAFIPKMELEDANSFVKNNEIKNHILIDMNEIFSDTSITSNPKDRCYHCKYKIFSSIKTVCEELGFTNICEGSNVDDLSDYRPGMKAIKELGILSPLKDAGYTKELIRQDSKELGLITWDKPSFACLASRIPYGEVITENKLSMIEEAESWLMKNGFNQLRVRIHGSNLARIEVPENCMEQLFLKRLEVSNKLKKIGFDFISMDLSGFKSGSMNVGIK